MKKVDHRSLSWIPLGEVQPGEVIEFDRGGAYDDSYIVTDQTSANGDIVHIVRVTTGKMIEAPAKGCVTIVEAEITIMGNVVKRDDAISKYQNQRADKQNHDGAQTVGASGVG